MRNISILMLLFSAFSGINKSFAQTDVKQVYDQSLEQQIKSSVGVGGYWDFYPSWYYSILHNRYKSRNYENNNLIPIDSMLVQTAASLLKVMQAHFDIDIVYKQEKAHWEDRNSDRELALMLHELNSVKEAIGILTNAFPEHKVPFEMAQICYDEYERISNQEKIIGNAHLDNSKKRIGYEQCLQNFIVLLNRCYKVNQYCEFVSHYDDIISVINK
jgi:hypothetical protein